MDDVIINLITAINRLAEAVEKLNDSKNEVVKAPVASEKKEEIVFKEDDLLIECIKIKEAVNSSISKSLVYHKGDRIFETLYQYWERKDAHAWESISKWFSSYNIKLKFNLDPEFKDLESIVFYK